MCSARNVCRVDCCLLFVLNLARARKNGIECVSYFLCMSQLRRKVQAEQAKLHRVVCEFLSAFDLRVLPWLESDRLLQIQGKSK